MVDLPLDVKFQWHNSIRLFPGDADAPPEPSPVMLSAAGMHLPIRYSSKERAVLELLDELPERESFHQVDALMEGLSDLSPRRLQTLLEACASVKVKRLFLFFADRHRHAWRSRLDVPRDAHLTDLRYRGSGWPGLMQARFRDADGVAHTTKGIPYAEGWGKILQADRRWRCRICTDHTGAFADISVGDPWHTPPAGHQDAGRSLIIARTPRGRAFIAAAIAAGVLHATPEGRDAIARAQPNLAATQGAVWGRRLMMRLTGMAVPADRGQPLFRFWLRLPARAKLSSTAGTLRRILRARLWRPVTIRGA
ncbi:MAG: hypothetical protein B7X55_04085 [Rhodobacterales bacterium 34-62-10]|nr:MAG: hypothetical protein B7X55_04085 [Rhodobacterales bacterium 34-62-10]